MASANLVKSKQARALTKLKMYALGVGSGVTPDNLKAVSGPVAGEDYETPTVAQLTAKLKELAARTCGARVFVRKRLAGNGADQADWGFSASEQRRLDLLPRRQPPHAQHAPAAASRPA